MLINSKKIDGQISRKALISTFGPNLMDSFLAPLKKFSPFSSVQLYVPNFEKLRPGDIILSRDAKKSKLGKKSVVEIAQKKTNRFGGDSCYWSHAMIYVGHGFVVESNIGIDLIEGLKRGLRTVPLTSYSMKADMIVCRPDGSKVGEDAAKYAMLNCLVDQRSYPGLRIILANLTQRPAKKKLNKAINCSEFALECLAVGAAYMVETFVHMSDGGSEYYPADFHHSDQFTKEEMTYLTLLEE